MKKTIITILGFIACLTVDAQVSQLLHFPRNCITNHVEKGNDGKRERNYYNDDCIDYTLIRGIDKIYTISPGKNTLYRYGANEKDRDFSKSEAQDIRLYPGRYVDKDMGSIVYAMPVKNGKETRCKFSSGMVTNRKDSVELKGVTFFMSPGDTIYAARSGVACQDVPNNNLYVYHEDGSIAIYINIKKMVKHEERIIAGQPIGTLPEGKKSMRIVVLFLDKRTLKNNLDSQFPYTCYIPMFRTTKGDMHIDGKLILTPDTDNALRMQEMTSKEKKRLLKGK